MILEEIKKIEANTFIIIQVPSHSYTRSLPFLIH